jgi:hypothetical protein
MTARPDIAGAWSNDVDDDAPTVERHCAWCGDEIPPWMRAGTRSCGKPCRQALARFRVAPAGSVAARPMRFAYADPPYPGESRKNYRAAEVDHEALVRRLLAEYPDGWALSTSSLGLPIVLDCIPRLVHRVSMRELRIGVWARGSRPGKSYYARDAFEALLVHGGRPVELGPRDRLDNLLVAHPRVFRTMPGRVPGAKPPEFSEWMFRMLGAQRGDRLDDLFPGSGAVTRAWRLFQR